MFDALKGLFSSKKFWMTIVGSVVVVVLSNVLPIFGLGAEMIDSVMTWIATFFGLGIGGIAVADFGKEAAKLKSGG